MCYLASDCVVSVQVCRVVVFGHCFRQRRRVAFSFGCKVRHRNSLHRSTRTDRPIPSYIQSSLGNIIDTAGPLGDIKKQRTDHNRYTDRHHNTNHRETTLIAIAAAALLASSLWAALALSDGNGWSKTAVVAGVLLWTAGFVFVSVQDIRTKMFNPYVLYVFAVPGCLVLAVSQGGWTEGATASAVFMLYFLAESVYRTLSEAKTPTDLDVRDGGGVAEKTFETIKKPEKMGERSGGGGAGITKRVLSGVWQQGDIDMAVLAGFPVGALTAGSGLFFAGFAGFMALELGMLAALCVIAARFVSAKLKNRGVKLKDWFRLSKTLGPKSAHIAFAPYIFFGAVAALSVYALTGV